MSDADGADAASFAALEAVLGHVFTAPALLEAALQHPSYAHEQDGTRGNERLEFLGDAVLELVTAQLLFEAHPRWEEGHLTRARAALVNTRALAERARELGLPAQARLGRTERRSGAEKESILANVFEAVVGALYLDGGLAPVFALARRLFGEALAPDSEAFAADPKTRFQEWAHAELRETPRYTAVDDSGVENDESRFEVEVRVAGEAWGRGRGRTKRAAERAAAEAALSRTPLG
jgi:ribonuclease-3